jgi:hypothetical protein
MKGQICPKRFEFVDVFSQFSDKGVDSLQAFTSTELSFLAR